MRPNAAIVIITPSAVMGASYNSSINVPLLLVVNAAAAPPADEVSVVSACCQPSWAIA